LRWSPGQTLDRLGNGDDTLRIWNPEFGNEMQIFGDMKIGSAVALEPGRTLDRLGKQ